MAIIGVMALKKINAAQSKKTKITTVYKYFAIGFSFDWANRLMKHRAAFLAPKQPTFEHQTIKNDDVCTIANSNYNRIRILAHSTHRREADS